MAKKTTKKVSSTRRAAEKPAAKKYSAKGITASKAARKHSASSGVAIATDPARESTPYAIHLAYNDYATFAREMTTSSGAGLPAPYHLGSKVDIQNFIENRLEHWNAQVLTDCTPHSRPFVKNGPNKDNILVEIDRGGNKQYRISIPAMICEDQYGAIDIDYLKQYVIEIKNDTSAENAAYALLGMYFLSRCR